ncbi:MAG: spore coat polysaccharide biosynthesis protein spsE [Chlamydiales bacterium 38-26]|nr:GNAT family N-acetyltransferase [Chlamydiales bacterium]OJV08459.1 MAG: spore coat polysaccharide biosynthesis protein spsE [Chlamydiales bacterium 38-26]
MDAKRIRFELVRPIEEDAIQIMEWRNDPETLRMSVHTQPKMWESFCSEFMHQYFLWPLLPPLFILSDRQRVAFVSFKPVEHPEQRHDRRCIEISINVAPEFRGLGWGLESLKATMEWAQKQGIDDIYAKVKIENLASQKAFTAAGYEALEDGKIEDDTGKITPVHRYIARLTPLKHPGVFIIAEAGSNWRMGSQERDWEMSKTLIDLAAEAGADAIKFQVFRPETIYVSNAGKSQYLSDAGIEKEMQEIFSDLAMPYELIPDLAAYCKKAGIEFMATPFSKSDFLAIDPYVKRHKIASYEIGHLRLIEWIARTGKPTYLSTGAANEEEIAWAHDIFYQQGGKELTLLQCTAKYPAEPDSMNLHAIRWLKDRFKCEVGLSDHSQHPYNAPIAAVALGARVIEKHFTLHSNLPGPDHAFAVNPQELKEMISAIRRTEQMLGSWVKTIHSSEQELRLFARRGIQALRPIHPGEILQEGVNIDILRPGQQILGLHPKYLLQMEGKKATRHLELGEGLQMGDWE